jgi:hypothetical protein
MDPCHHALGVGGQRVRIGISEREVAGLSAFISDSDTWACDSASPASELINGMEEETETGWQTIAGLNGELGAANLGPA